MCGGGETPPRGWGSQKNIFALLIFQSPPLHAPVYCIINAKKNIIKNIIKVQVNNRIFVFMTLKKVLR